jgi:hypothetical protein
MNQDPDVRQQAHSVLASLFSHLGSQGSGPGGSGGGLAGAGGALSGQLVEFMEMPVDLARIFLDMSVQLTDLVLTSLEEAGIVLVRGLSPM